MNMENGNLHMDPQEWVKKLFEFEYCDECGGDSEHHTVIDFNGNWFARCNYSLDKDGNFHSVIKESRKL